MTITQAYSEDGELDAMLARARRRLFPMPTTVLSDAVEKRPIVALATYAALLFVIMHTAAALVLTFTGGFSGSVDAASSAAADMTSATLRFYVGGGGRAAAGVNAAAEAGRWSGGGGVPYPVFLLALPATLLAGLAPAVAFVIGYKRRTDAYWRRWVF